MPMGNMTEFQEILLRRVAQAVDQLEKIDASLNRISIQLTEIDVVLPTVSEAEKKPLLLMEIADHLKALRGAMVTE